MNMQRLARFLAVLSAVSVCWLPGIAGAVGAGDDYGDSAAAAYTIPFAATSVTGRISVDPDEDWFQVRVLPQAACSITASTGSISDVEWQVLVPDGVSSVGVTNTVRAPSGGAIRWTNTGVAAYCYVRVAGMFHFTTGTYVVAVSPLNATDSDQDGMIDSWENKYFGNLTNGPTGDYDHDGVNNRDEYYAGTNPTNATSRLAITAVTVHTNAVVVTWPSVLYGAYRLQVATNTLTGPSWRPVVTNTNMDGSAYDSGTDPNATDGPPHFYKVELLY